VIGIQLLNHEDSDKHEHRQSKCNAFSNWQSNSNDGRQIPVVPQHSEQTEACQAVISCGKLLP